jgi:YVTN family beta-propeller protein
VPLPGDTSRFDYESLDPQTHRLYISHLGAGTIALYDIPSGTVVGEIHEVPGVHGVLAVPDLGRGYATATSSNQAAVVDPQSLAVIATIPGGVYPDGLAYDPEVHKLYVSDETSVTDTAIDTTSNQVVTIDPRLIKSADDTMHLAATIRTVSRSDPTGGLRSSPARQTPRVGTALRTPRLRSRRPCRSLLGSCRSLAPSCRSPGV